jgi:hypothetical protein
MGGEVAGVCGCTRVKGCTACPAVAVALGGQRWEGWVVGLLQVGVSGVQVFLQQGFALL